MNVGEVYFVFRGTDFDPDEITKSLGIEPSRIARQAVPVPKCSSWVLSSGQVTAEVIDVYAMGESVVSRLRDAAESIRSVSAKFGLDMTLQVVLTVSPDDRLSTPAIGFSADIVRFLAAVGASIDVDTYRGAS